MFNVWTPNGEAFFIITFYFTVKFYGMVQQQQEQQEQQQQQKQNEQANDA